MDLEFLVGIAASVIINAVKNPAKKAQLKSVMFKIWTVIGNTYNFNQETKQ